MALGLGIVVVCLGHVFDGIGRADDFGGAFLAFGGPEGQAGEEAAVGVFQLDEGVGDVAAVARGGEVVNSCERVEWGIVIGTYVVNGVRARTIDSVMWVVVIVIPE